MSLGNTLGVCLLLLWPPVILVPNVSAGSVWDVARSQENQARDSSPQSSSSKSPAEPQKAPDGSTPDQSTAPQPATVTTSGCPKNPPSASTTKTGCKQAAGTRAKKQPGTQKPAAPPVTSGHTLPTTVVKDGSIEDSKVNLSPDPSPQASKQGDRTKQLLESSQANLKKISGRPLNESQEETVEQINSYMEQSREAAKGGDPQRAYNLAVKANLLSAELAGH
jgi:hypothetical protein